MESTVQSAREGGVVEDHAVHVHEESAARHEAAAAVWDTRHEPGWAEFERSCARLEREAAKIEASRTDLERLRARWLKHPDGDGRAEIERLSTQIRRRTAQLKATDADLERERDRLRDQKQRTRRLSVAGPGLIANERVEVPAPLKRVADQRQEKDGERQLGKQLDAGAGHESRADEHPSPPGEPTELAKRATETAVRHAQEGAQRLSRVLVRTAVALEKSAALADQHAQRLQLAGRSGNAVAELQVAERARAAASRARSQAAQWLELSRAGSGKAVGRDRAQEGSTE